MADGVGISEHHRDVEGGGFTRRFVHRLLGHLQGQHLVANHAGEDVAVRPIGVQDPQGAVGEEVAGGASLREGRDRDVVAGGEGLAVAQPPDEEVGRAEAGDLAGEGEVLTARQLLGRGRVDEEGGSLGMGVCGGRGGKMVESGLGSVSPRKW